jgi:uncharacterized protein
MMILDFYNSTTEVTMFSARKGNLFSLFFVLHFILASYVLFYVATNIFQITDDIHRIGLSQIFLVLFPVFYYFLVAKTPIKDTLRYNKTKFVNYIFSGLLAFFIMPLVMLINVISQFFVKQALNDTLATIGNYNYFYIILIIAVFPSIFEEMISRGIILSHFRYRSYWVASLMSGFFFGMMHLNINQFLYAFVLGFIFSIVLHLTGSIFCTILMHFIINGFNVSLAYIASSDFFKALAEAQSAAGISLDQNELLIQALPIVFFFVILSLPFVLLVLYGLIAVNEKTQLVFKATPSYAFFIPIKNYNDIIAEQGETKELNASIIEELTENAFIQKGQKEKIITIPLLLTVLIFIVASLLNELSL